MRFSKILCLAGFVGGIGLSNPFPLRADETPPANVPGVAPLPPPTSMDEDELTAFFLKQKKGTPVQLTLAKNKVVNGLFNNFDEYYETVWLVPQGEKGVFQTKGYRLSGIHNAVLWDRKVEPGLTHNVDEAGNRDYYLIKDSGLK